MGDLGNNSLTNMDMGPASITDITKPYPAKEPLPESNLQDVSNIKHNFEIKLMLCLTKLNN